MSKKRLVLVVLIVFLLFNLIVNAQETSVTKVSSDGKLTIDKKALDNLKEGTFKFSSKTNLAGDLTFEMDNSGEKSKVTIDPEILKNLEDISIGGDVGGYYLLVKMKGGKTQEERKYYPFSDIGSLSELKIPFSGRFESNLESLGKRLRLTFDSTTEKNIPVKSGGLPVKTDKGLLVSNERNLDAFETEWILSSFQKLNKDQFPIETQGILAALKEQGQEFTGNLEFIFGEQATVVSINTGELSRSLNKQLDKFYEDGIVGRITLQRETKIDDDNKDERRTRLAIMDLEKEAKIDHMQIAAIVKEINPFVKEAQKAPPIKIDSYIRNAYSFDMFLNEPSTFTGHSEAAGIISSRKELIKTLDPVKPTRLEDLIKQKEKEVEDLKVTFKKNVDEYGLYSQSNYVKDSQKQLKIGEAELKELNKMAKKINKAETKQVKR